MSSIVCTAAIAVCTAVYYSCKDTYIAKNKQM